MYYSSKRNWASIDLSTMCVHAQSCQMTPMVCSPSVSSVHGIFKARILEWVAIYSSNLNSPAMSIMSINHPSKSNISHDPALNAK